jgi:hypothetical protein
LKIHEYNEMMAYLTRPRQRYENGGPVIPEAKPSPEEVKKIQWNNKLKLLKKLRDGMGQRDWFNLVSEHLDDGLEENIITREQFNEALSPLFGQAGEVHSRALQKENSMPIKDLLEIQGEKREDYPAYLLADGGRIKAADGVAVQTLNPRFPTINPADTESFKPLDLPVAMIPPLAIGAGAKRIKDTFFSKDKGEDRKEIIPSDKNEPPMKTPDEEPPGFQEISEDILIDTAINRLKKKEMDPAKRDERTSLARTLNLPVTRSGMVEIRKGDYFNKRLQTLKDKGVNFDGYFSVPEIANLLGTKSSSGINSYIQDQNIPTVKKGLFKVVKLNDFLNVYQGTKERVDMAPPVELGTLARNDFLSEVGGSFYQRFKDMRRPKFLPKDVKEVYEKYNLGEIEGGHPFPIEFFTKKFGKGNTLQKDRQFDWIYRNKDKLFSKNNLVFQSKEVNKLFRNEIKNLKKLYKELSPLVNKYEGKGEVTNKEDIKTIESLNNKIMDIIAKSEFDAKDFIEKSKNKTDLPRFKTGGLHGAIFNTDTGEVSLYTGAGEGAGFESIGKEPTDVKLKLAGDYADIINNLITDETDRKIFTNYLDKDLLPKFQRGGPVYGKYAKQIAGIS